MILLEFVCQTVELIMFMFALLSEFSFVNERDTPIAYRPLDALFLFDCIGRNRTLDHCDLFVNCKIQRVFDTNLALNKLVYRVGAQIMCPLRYENYIK